MGSSTYGVIFSVALNGTDYTVIKNFDLQADGAYPVGSLLEANDGNLYGMTRAGGANFSSMGTIFKINPDGINFTLLKRFNHSTLGAHP